MNKRINLLTTFVVILVAIIIVLVTYNIAIYYKSDNKRTNFVLKKALQKTNFSTINADTLCFETRVTVYNPTVEQCNSQPFITADGSHINPEKPQRWIAVTQKWLKHFPYGSTVYLEIPDAPYLNGEWEVHDTGCKGVDILISNPTKCKVMGCWQGKIFKITHDTIIL